MSHAVQLDRDGLTKDQLASIEKFESDYNVVDKLLRKETGADRGKLSFVAVVQKYAERRRHWRGKDVLLMVAEVRNAIVHNKTDKIRYVAVPTPTLAASLATCRASLESPELVLPRLKRPVTSVAMDESLSSILRKIADCDYSQFPVYLGERFTGLLTENGITRWLATHVTKEGSMVEFDDVAARDLLGNEEARENFAFVSRDLPLDELPVLFADKPELEAVFITESGKKSERMIGVATQWDCLQLKKTAASFIGKR